MPDITAPLQQTSAANGTLKPDEAAGQPETPESTLRQSIATLGIALVAMGEDIGSQMSLRLFGNLVCIGLKILYKLIAIRLNKKGK